MSKIRRPMVKVSRSRQITLDLECDEAVAKPLAAPDKPRFVEPDRGDLLIGMVPLDQHLKAMGERSALVIAPLLDDLDWSRFEAAYSPEGRPAHAPRLMTGLVLMGLLQGISSLRGLEQHARVHLGGMWVAAGITPDHSVIGRFINRHADALTDELFDSIVRRALKATSSDCHTLAGDGTTLEAVSSRFRMVKKEATQQKENTQATPSTESTSDDEPDDSDPKPPSTAGRTLGRKWAVPTEPEASVLKLKNNRGYRPAYEGCVLANEARVVVDAELHGSSEQQAMVNMMWRWADFKPNEILLDAGFFNYTTLELSVEQDVSMLCPERAEHPKKPPKYFPLRAFDYDESADHYHCPAGQTLTVKRRAKGNPAQRKRAYVEYGTAACPDCPLRSQCTSGKHRSVQRTDGQMDKN